MLSVLMVTFREGVEAFLIVAVTLLYLRQTRRLHLIAAARWGVACAVLLSIALGVVLSRVGAMQPLHEAWLAVAAFVLVLSCTAHMLLHGKRIAGDIRQKIEASDRGSETGAKIAVFLFVLLMIGREGIETATMLASLASTSGLRPLFVGGTLGVMLAGLLAFSWTRYGRRVNLGLFFRVTAVFMVLFSIQLVVYAVHEFTEAGVVPGIDNSRWHLLTEPFGPEGQYGAWLSYSLVLVPLGFFVVTWLRDQGWPLGSRRQ